MRVFSDSVYAPKIEYSLVKLDLEVTLMSDTRTLEIYCDTL